MFHTSVLLGEAGNTDECEREKCKQINITQQLPSYIYREE